MRNPVNRLATAAPRAFDSILKQPSTNTLSTTTTSTPTDSTNNITQDKRSRSASFHMDLSVLLHTTSSVDGVNAPGSVGDETGSVLTFDAAMDMIPNAAAAAASSSCWDWNEESEVGL
mmetsp:Transcript_12980/g.20032  ORF Transcript_12980/g.20032 Transcript_12980/m.20032 type:complete len:118 (+) Transcript_12980:162-515(+)